MAGQWRDLGLGLTVDFGFCGVDEAGGPAALAPAILAMAAIEAGAIANASEGRAVGHYWLRAPGLAPGTLGEEIVRVR